MLVKSVNTTNAKVTLTVQRGYPVVIAIEERGREQRGVGVQWRGGQERERKQFSFRNLIFTDNYILL
jgi:hypothetical protein